MKSANFKYSRTRRTLTQVCRFAAYLGLSYQFCAGMGNSPFGAWVVCVYRIQALQSLTRIDATTRAFFVFSRNLAKFIAERGELQKFKTMEAAMASSETKATLRSLFELAKPELELSLQGLQLPKDSSKIQDIVTKQMNNLLNPDSDFCQGLTMAEGYMVQAALSLLNAEQSLLKKMQPAISKSYSFEQLKRTSKNDDLKLSEEPHAAMAGAGAGAFIGGLVGSSFSAMSFGAVGWASVFGAIAGTAVSAYVVKHIGKKQDVVLKSNLILEHKADSVIDVSSFIEVIANICDNVDSLLEIFRNQISKVVEQSEKNAKMTLEGDYRLLLENVQSLIGFNRTHNEDEKYARKINERIEEFVDCLDNYDLTVVDYSAENAKMFEQIPSSKTNEVTMAYPAIVKKGVVVLKGKVFIPG